MGKVKFPLDMGNKIMARSIEELKENYNAEKVTEYFLNGKLLTWLEVKCYDEEADQVRALSESGGSPAVGLAKIFGVDVEEDVDVDALEIRRQKLEKLRAVTSDDEILDNVDSVAFSQEDLGDLLDEGTEIIYLCGESFRIPFSVKNVKYVGVNNPAITVGGNGEIDFEANGIVIEKCKLPKEIEEKISLPKIDSEYKIRLYIPKQTETVRKNNVVLAAEYADEFLYIYFRELLLSIPMHNIDMNYQIFVSHKKSGESSTIANYLSIGPRFTNSAYREGTKKPISITTVYAKGNSAFEIYKMQMLEALDNLPKEFKKKDGMVDKTGRETIAAVEEAVRLFIEYNGLKAEKPIQYLEDEEEPYD